MEAGSVSLVIGTYNPNREWFDAALASAQGLFDEIVIVDDGSDPAVPEATVHSVSNRGFAQTRNTGIAWAKGEIIASLDDDDEFIPENVVKFKEFVHQTDADVWSFPIQMFGDRTGMWATDPNMDRIYENNQIPSGSWFKKSVWEKIGGFRLPIAEDWDFWSRAHYAGCKFAHFSLPVYRHRMRAQSKSQDLLNGGLAMVSQKIQEACPKR